MNTTLEFDPKTEVTEHAFKIPDHILGLALARPWKRLGAILLDLFLIAIMSEAGFFALSGLIAVLSYRRYRNRTIDTKLKKFRNRLAASGIGLVMFFVSISILSIFDEDGDSAAKDQSIVIKSSVKMDDFSSIDWTQFSKFENFDSLKADDLNKMLEQVEHMFDHKSDVSLSHAQASIENIGLVASYLKAVDQQEFELADSLRPKAAKIVAAPEIRDFQKQIKKLKTRILDNKGTIEELNEKIENPSFMTSVYAAANDLGFAFGWAGMYFVFSLAWFNGQTLGKRVFKIRVIKLNGKPISVWYSFERFGGLAAGIATGFLGFAQIYWDPNRQAIHDKISATVVIDEK